MAKKASLKGNKIIVLIAALLMVMVFFGSLTFLKNLIQEETYYVLNTELPTRTMVLPENLQPVTTSKGTAPVGISLEQVQAGGVFTRYPVGAGDVLTASNTTSGGLDDIASGVPDSWVVTSFSVPADNAAGGRITRGVYFDMMILSDDGTYFPYVNMLALDTSVSLSGASNSNAINTEEAKSGQTSMYYVAMPPAEVAKFQDMIRQHGGAIQLIMSPRQNEYMPVDLSAYEGPFKFDLESQELIDSGVGTDNSFAPADRDEFGRPKDVVDGKVAIRCGNAGNSIVEDGGQCTEREIDNNEHAAQQRPAGR